MAAVAEVPASPSQSSFVFPRPPSPTKPNAHPYPIKTTATGVLSRSNSVSASPSTRHHYIPPTPPSPSASAKEEGAARRSEYRGHRYSRSLSSSEDMYLPSHDDNGTKEMQTRGPRALPVPPNVSNNSIASLSMLNAEPRTSPKRWTPEQLAAHLGQAVSQEASEWAVRRGVGGRAFMRMAEEDMVKMGAPASLRPVARALRQEVLHGQFDFASPGSSSGSESGFLTAYSPTRRTSPTRMSPTRGMASSPTRIDEEREVEDQEDDDDTPSRGGGATARTPHIRASAVPFMPPSPSSPFADAPGRYRNGRVRGMVRSFESSGSESGSEWDGSPERAPSAGGGSGFRRVNTGSGSSDANGVQHGNGSAFRHGRSGFHAKAHGGQESSGLGSEESDGQWMGATVRPQRALPARPDGVEVGVVDLEPAVSVPEPTRRALEDEPTVEELLALETPDSAGSDLSKGWRRTWRRSRGKAGAQDREAEEASASAPVVQQTTGGGGRPLPSHPAPRPFPRSTSGVHAWEAEEGVVGSTVKRVQLPAASMLFDRVASTSVPLTAAAMREAQQCDRLDEKPQLDKEKEKAKEQLKAEQEAAAAARGRDRGAAVRKQMEAAKREGVVLRGLVEAFRVRLEEVERKIGEMEVQVATAAASASNSSEDQTKTTPVAAAVSAPPFSLARRLNPCRLLQLLAFAPSQESDSRSPRRGNKNAEDAFVGPTTISGLPSYVLLVGLGVCAVVLRVLVRRGLGLGVVRRRG